jgi:hypothetical protein
MDDYITKPMRHTDLNTILWRWIPSQTEAVGRTPVVHDSRSVSISGSRAS